MTGVLRRKSLILSSLEWLNALKWFQNLQIKYGSTSNVANFIYWFEIKYLSLSSWWLVNGCKWVSVSYWKFSCVCQTRLGHTRNQAALSFLPEDNWDAVYPLRAGINPTIFILGVAQCLRMMWKLTTTWRRWRHISVRHLYIFIWLYFRFLNKIFVSHFMMACKCTKWM